MQIAVRIRTMTIIINSGLREVTVFLFHLQSLQHMTEYQGYEKETGLLGHLVLGKDGIALCRIFLESASVEEKLTESSAKKMYLEPEIGSGPPLYRLSLNLLKWQCLSIEGQRLWCQASSIPWRTHRTCTAAVFMKRVQSVVQNCVFTKNHKRHNRFDSHEIKPVLIFLPPPQIVGICLPIILFIFKSFPTMYP